MQLQLTGVISAPFIIMKLLMLSKMQQPGEENYHLHKLLCITSHFWLLLKYSLYKTVFSKNLEADLLLLQ